jgi:thioredoxin-related protein
MKLFSFLLFAIVLQSTTGWETDFEHAKQKAKDEHKYILLNFSGSDWCVPCIRLHDEVFEESAFKAFSDSNLVLLNADFPRLKKHLLSKEQQTKNDKLADKYDPQGIFPLTLLLNEKGEVVKAWDGFPDLTPQQFVSQINSIIHANP